MITPNDLEILIHCYCRPEEHPRISAPAVQETIKRFMEDGIIKRDQNNEYFITTGKGTAWLRSILSVPYPTQVWIDKDGNVIYDGIWGDSVWVQSIQKK